MAQEINVNNPDNATDYTFQSTTDSTTLTLSDDKFAEIMTLNNLIIQLRSLTNALRKANG